MSAYEQLPALNAALNATSAVLLLAGWMAVRARHLRAHRRWMLAACATSTLFLCSYVVYHLKVGSVRFPGTGFVRGVYLGILLTHVVLAAAIVPMAGLTLYLGLRVTKATLEQIESANPARNSPPEPEIAALLSRHRRIARWTFPAWMYVSVTGVVIYGMLYHGNFGQA